MRPRLLLSAMLVAVLLVPGAVGQSAGSGSTPTTLYFHVFDTFNRFPINTQPMDVDFFDVGGTNFPTVASQGYDFNTIYGYSTAGPVEYDFIENGRPRFHPERGIAADVELDPAVQPVAHVYVDVRDVLAGNAFPMALPTFTVRVTVREGDDFGDVTNLDAGNLIMEGRLSAHVIDLPPCAPACHAPLEGQAGPDGRPVLVPDEAGVVEFAIPMEVAQQRIPKKDAFNVRIDWWQDLGGAFGDDEFSTGYMRLVADAAHLPRLDLAVKNPIRFDFVHPQVAAGILLIHAGVLSPWGTYDVDVANMTLTVDGPSAPKELEQVVAQHAHVHGLHDSAAEVTYLWRFRDEGAANGAYTLKLTAPNLAGTATAEATAGFRVEAQRAYGLDEQGEVIEPLADENVNETPGPGATLAALATLGAALATRRRWRQ